MSANRITDGVSQNVEEVKRMVESITCKKCRAHKDQPCNNPECPQKVKPVDISVLAREYDASMLEHGPSLVLTMAYVTSLRSALTACAKRPSNDHVVQQVLLGVCELPDYNSPDDQPELLQCTTKELELVVRRALGEDP